MKILVLSPHRDDAAFSLGLTIRGWLGARHTVTILNVFTRSLYAPFSDAEFVHENDRLSYVSAIRLREDELFLQRLPEELSKAAKNNVRMVDLNLKDAPVRLRCTVGEVCDRAVNPDDPAMEKIRKALAKQAEAGAMEALVMPVGMGRHVDHLTVRDAALSLTDGLPSAFYEDVPYSVTHPSAAGDLSALREERIARLNETLSPVVFEGGPGVEWKRRVVGGYGSQIGDRSTDLICDATERLWVNDAWSKAL